MAVPTTWHTNKGTAEELQIHVANPEDFTKHRENTVVIVLGETALWLKCRGAEQVYDIIRKISAIDRLIN